MEKFIYYEIAGFLPSSFISHRLGNVVKFESREKAIEVLEEVIKEWREREAFCAGGELVNEVICEERFSDYQHQFAFKGKRTGRICVDTYRVVEHKILYIAK